MRSIPRNQSGVAAVEFAIILPLLLLVIFGIIELSLYLFNKHVITNASREGARAGIVARFDRFVPGEDGDEVDVRGVVQSWCQEHLVTFGGSNELQDDDIDVEIIDRSTGNFAAWETIVDEEGNLDDGPCATFHCPLRVTVRYNYDFLVLSIFGFGPRNIDARSVMLME